MNNLHDVATQLYELSNQYVDKPDNVFAKMARVVERSIEDIDALNKTLTVPAAEYVPAIQDAFKILDRMVHAPDLVRSKAVQRWPELDIQTDWRKGGGDELS